MSEEILPSYDELQSTKLVDIHQEGTYLYYQDPFSEPPLQSIRRVDNIIMGENDVEYSGKCFDKTGVERYWSSTTRAMETLEHTPLRPETVSFIAKDVWGYKEI